MTIDALLCRPDGTQILEQRTVPDNWLDLPAKEPAPLPRDELPLK